MRFLSFFRHPRSRRRGAPRERERLQNAMPGETGALAALRLGMLVG